MSDTPSNPYSKGFGPGEFFDAQSYRGLALCLLLSLGMGSMLWYFYDLLAFARQLLEIPYSINRAKQGWVQHCALITGGIGVITSIYGLTMLAIKDLINRENINN